jgi:hypothetical protein
MKQASPKPVSPGTEIYLPAKVRRSAAAEDETNDEAGPKRICLMNTKPMLRQTWGNALDAELKKRVWEIALSADWSERNKTVHSRCSPLLSHAVNATKEARIMMTRNINAEVPIGQ